MNNLRELLAAVSVGSTARRQLRSAATSDLVVQETRRAFAVAAQTYK